MEVLLILSSFILGVAITYMWGINFGWVFDQYIIGIDFFEFMVLFFIVIFLASTGYFSQTDYEKSILRFIIPVAVIAVFMCLNSTGIV